MKAYRAAGEVAVDLRGDSASGDGEHGHLADHALLVDGPVHKTDLVGPRDTHDPAAWRTEVG